MFHEQGVVWRCDHSFMARLQASDRKPFWQMCWSPKPHFLWCPVRMGGHQEAIGCPQHSREMCSGSELPQGQRCPHWRLDALLCNDHLWCPEVVPALKNTCPEIRPGVSSHLLQPVTGAWLSPQCFPQGKPKSTACGWQLGMPGHFFCHSLKVRPRSLINPLVKGPCMAQLSENNHWYCHEAESTQRVNSSSSNYKETYPPSKRQEVSKDIAQEPPCAHVLVGGQQSSVTQKQGANPCNHPWAAGRILSKVSRLRTWDHDWKAF